MARSNPAINPVDQEPIVTVQLQDVMDQAPPSLATLMNATDNDLMQAVEDNDVAQLKEMLSGATRVDLNFINASGETPLQIAVKNKHTGLIQILLENGADIGNALIQAVSEESLECVKFLLEFEEKKGRRASTFNHDEHYHATPLIVAAINNSYDIVKFLLSKGHFIDDRDLHDRTCECRHCEREGRLGCSLRRLNVYRGLASPVYLSLSYIDKTTEALFQKEDPIIEAFVLNKKLLKLSHTEYEFKAEYKALSVQCEDFAVSLLDQCRNMSEIEMLMSVPTLEDMQYVKIIGHEDLSRKLSVLNFAIKNNIKKFVAHSYSQMILNSVLYKGFRKWEDFGIIKKIAFGIGFTLLLPIWSIMLIFCPQYSLSQKLTIPIVKFLAHTGSFCVFLVLLFLSSIQDLIFNPLQTSITALDYLLILWISGLALEEVKEFLRQGRHRYTSQFWNIVTMVMLLLFLIAGILWISGYALQQVPWAISFKEALGMSKNDLQAYTLILLSNSFFAMAFLLAFLHMSNTLQVNSIMGPLQLSLVKMTRDILKFLFLFIFIYAAFTMAIRKVYSQFVWAQRSYGNQTMSHNGFSSIFGSMRLTFWAVFDKTELEQFKTDPSFPTQVTQNTGEVLFALFNITILLVAINMLIAMMSNSFQSIADNSDVLWKFSRTHMWMTFIDKGSALPPPFNIIPSVADILHLLRLLFTRKLCPKSCCHDCSESGDVPQPTTSGTFSYQRKDFINHLIQRHFYNLEKDRVVGAKVESVTQDEIKTLARRLDMFMLKLEGKAEQGAEDEEFKQV